MNPVNLPDAPIAEDGFFGAAASIIHRDEPTRVATARCRHLGLL